MIWISEEQYAENLFYFGIFNSLVVLFLCEDLGTEVPSYSLW